MGLTESAQSDYVIWLIPLSTIPLSGAHFNNHNYIKSRTFCVTSIELSHFIPVLCEPNVERLLTQELHQIIIMKFSHYLIGKTVSTISALTLSLRNWKKITRDMWKCVCVWVCICVSVSVCVYVCVWVHVPHPLSHAMWRHQDNSLFIKTNTFVQLNMR
jgi:hypothetical protein